METTKQDQQIYALFYKDKFIIEGTFNNCFFKLLDIQPNSCNYALNYGEYKIINKTKQL